MTLAFAALERDGWYFGKAGDKARKDIEKHLLDAVKRVEVPDATPIAVELARPTSALHFGRLAFEPGGSLLIASTTGMVRASASGEVVPAEDAASAWPLDVVRPDGSKATALVAACDQSVISIGFTAASGAPADAQTTDLLAPRPGSCKGGRAAALSLAPQSWKDGTLEALLAGEPVGPRLSRAEAALRPQVRGSSRSPGGKLMVVPGTLGLLVTGGDKPELWRIKAGSALQECTVADRAARVACVDHGTVRVWVRP